MVERIEEIGRESQVRGFREAEVLEDGCVHVPVSGPEEERAGVPVDHVGYGREPYGPVRQSDRQTIVEARPEWLQDARISIHRNKSLKLGGVHIRGSGGIEVATEVQQLITTVVGEGQPLIGAERRITEKILVRRDALPEAAAEGTDARDLPAADEGVGPA